MEKKNILAEIALKTTDPIVAFLLISNAVISGENQDLIDFFKSTAVGVLFLKGNDNPTDAEVAEEMLVVTQGTAQNIAGAVMAYQEYLDRGVESIAESLALAAISMGVELPSKSKTA